MEASTTYAIDRVVPDLKPFWKYWNVGALPYFKRKRDAPKARLRPWNHTAKMAEAHELRALINPDSGGRWVPAGKYVGLEVWQASYDDMKAMNNIEDGEEIWETVMTDTPDEMNDHRDVIINANGRVLIHGLGLGCVLNCVLNKPEVHHIDVVEANEDVIKLVSPFYLKEAKQLNKSLIIKHGSAIDPLWPKGTHWNYVWHDIWTQISISNLKQDEGDPPEHGISYELLHRKFQNRCDRQGSWAFERAQAMRRVNEYEDRIAAKWAWAWNARNPADRWEMLLDAVLPYSEISKEAYVEFLKHPLNPAGKEMFAQYERAVQERITPFDAKMMLGDRLRRYAVQQTRFNEAV